MLPLDREDLDDPPRPKICPSCGRRHLPLLPCRPMADGEDIGAIAWFIGWTVVLMIVAGLVHLIATLTTIAP